MPGRRREGAGEPVPDEAEHHLLLSTAFEQQAKNAWKAEDFPVIEEPLRKALREAHAGMKLDPRHVTARVKVAGLQEKLVGLVVGRGVPSSPDRATRRRRASGPGRATPPPGPSPAGRLQWRCVGGFGRGGMGSGGGSTERPLFRRDLRAGPGLRPGPVRRPGSGPMVRDARP